MFALIGGIAAILAIVLIASGKARTLVNGFMSLFVENLAKTPEGAEAVYTKAIEEAQDEYATADDTYQRIVGQLNSEKDNLAILKKQLNDIEKKIEALVIAGKEEQAIMLANQREEVLSDVNNAEVNIDKLTGASTEALEMKQIFEKKLLTLKKEKRNIVNNLKLDNQLKEAYDSLDELKKASSTEKLVDAVKEGAKDKREMAVGARASYNGKVSTQLERADKEAKKLAGNDYINSLKAKHGMNSVSDTDGFNVREKIKN